jgi:hypothetical protein
MKQIYRIRPTDKKSVEVLYDVYSDKDGEIRSWSVTELYRWGQGFVEDKSELPFSDDKYHIVDGSFGWGTELDDLCAVDFEFDDSFDEEEKQQIEDAWEEGGAGWLYDGEHDWLVDYVEITILGPFTVDIVDEDEYNSVIETDIELKPRPPFEATSSWPFGDNK